MATTTAPAATPTTKPTGAVLPASTEEGLRFWVGVVEDAPFHSLTVAGVKFQRESFALVRNAAGEIVDDNRTGFAKVDEGVGVEVTIPQAQMDILKECIDRRVTGWVDLPDRVDAQGRVLESGRKRGRTERTHVRDITGKWLPRAYTRIKNEQPVGRFLFVLPAEERRKYRRGDPIPTVTAR